MPSKAPCSIGWFIRKILRTIIFACVFCLATARPVLVQTNVLSSSGFEGVWTARLTYLLLRYVAFLSQWGHSCSRLFTVLRTSLWKKWNLLGLLRRYGTAEGHFRYLARPEQAFLPGMS